MAQGLTQCRAILRIEAELERMASDQAGPPPLCSSGRQEPQLTCKQVVWFLAPTVSLCDQQSKVVKDQVPWVQSKLVTGANNVDSWSAVTWEKALTNVKIIITTHQVLLDALIHGFVKISSLALLVFDEGRTLPLTLGHSQC